MRSEDRQVLKRLLAWPCTSLVLNRHHQNPIAGIQYLFRQEISRLGPGVQELKRTAGLIGQYLALLRVSRRC